ncbi:hypothetical protein OO013_03665 [Mangrovivirga sp. M17]|uniref:Uncharacterized protein n=1 Tax=Mangrovivirga halotolerans TaxID=2993936 RepID=A0ABT3RNM3_9BACT|nr:hypothetical protein [Mangrovivirga halotolerans]MCX2742948.1 hypothetical protein [Mangrovivirga halotolerans]
MKSFTDIIRRQFKMLMSVFAFSDHEINEAITISNNCYGNIDVVGDVQYLCISIKGIIEPKDFVEIMEWGLDKVSKGNNNIIINSSDLRAMPGESIKYMEEEWLPNALKENVKLLVFIRPKDLFGYISLESISKKFPIINYKFVPSLLDAQLEILKVN